MTGWARWPGIRRWSTKAKSADGSGELTRRISEARSALALYVRRLRHSPALRRASLKRVGAITAALAVTLYVSHLSATAEEIRNRWDATETVLVSTQNLSVGDTLSEANTRAERRPVGNVPDGALSKHPETEVVVTQAMTQGELVLEIRLNSDTTDVPPNHGAITVTAQSALPGLTAGDNVDVVSGAAVNWSDDPAEDSPAQVVTRGATVLDIVRADNSDPSVTLLVRDRDITALSDAALSGPVVVVIRG